MEGFLEQLLEAWRTNNRVNLLLLDNISPEGLSSTLSTRGGRSVARQFAHLHNVRIYQLEGRARDLAQGLEKFPGSEAPSAEKLKHRLNQSASRIETFFQESFAGVPKRRVFKKGLITHLGYFISHESHHRGSILLTLKQSGHAVDKNTAYGIWNWDKI